MPPCLTLSIIRYGSRVKWRNPGKGVAPSPTPWCSSYWKGSLRVTLDYGRLLMWITICDFSRKYLLCYQCNIVIIYGYTKYTWCLYTDVLNVHMHRNPETLTSLLVQVRNLYYLLDIEVFNTRRERHTIFTMLTVRPASALNSLTQ